MSDFSRRQFLGTSAAVLALPRFGFGASGFSEYLEFDALGLADLVRRNEISPVDLLDAAITRVEAIDPQINAVVTRMYDEARATIENGIPDGPFAGVPFLLKDLGAIYRGVRTTFGSRLFDQFLPEYDDELVRRYKAAGLVTMGRTNTPEFGLNASTESVLLGACRNPWDTTRSSGGSSGGSGAAVAARMVPIAHASDGGGSIRIPSSCCGVFGMKPSRGRQPTGPDAGEQWEGFATDHAVSISVRDNAAMLDATSAPETGAPYGIPAPARPFLEEVSTDPGRLRIAMFTKGAAEDTHPDCVAAVRDVATLCEELGHDVVEDAPALDYDNIKQAFSLIVESHTAAMLDQFAERYGRNTVRDSVEPATLGWAEGGWKASAADFANTKSVINHTTRRVAEFLTWYDVILTPTLAAPPPKLGYLDTVNLPFKEFQKRLFDFLPFTWLHNLTGLPAVSVPLYWNAEGLPIGVQFAAPYADEATLYRLAGQLEQARPWRDRIPHIAV